MTGPWRDVVPDSVPPPMLNLGREMVDDRGTDFRVPELDDIIACTPAQLGGNGRLLLVDGRALAALGDPAAITTMIARIGGGGSLAELIATLVAARPTGLLVLGDPAQHYALALMLQDGAVTAVLAPGPYGECGSWVLEFHRRRLGSPLWLAETNGARVDPSKTFLLEHAVAAIARCDCAGASLLWMTGAVQWLGDKLPVATSCDAGFLLLELARRCDEGPRVEAAIGALDRVVVPTSRPGPRAAKPVERRKAGVDEDAWDFFDDPDPAAEAEWADARHVFECCDGMTSIANLVERAMIGHFRTLQAVLALLERAHVTLTEVAHSPDASGELADLIADLGIGDSRLDLIMSDGPMSQVA